MQRTVLLILFCCAAGAFSHAQAGPYPPAAGKPGSTAVHKDDPAFAAWAAGWVDPVHYGRDVDESWKTPRNALGKAEGTASGVVSLGEGGSIVLTFDFPIRNGDGWDFAVFENSYSDTFLELAFVEVSSDGVNFIRFENHSLTPAPVNAFGSVDPTDITGFAGKYRQGYGTPFDLQDLAERDEVLAGTVNLSRITHVRIVDIMGNGEYTDSHGNIIYDPYPTKGSAGFDLDAVGVRHLNTSDQAGNNPPDRPTLLSPTDNAPAVPCAPLLETNPFSDPDAEDLHLRSLWEISDQGDFSESAIVFRRESSVHLTSLKMPGLVLEEGKSYWWRVMFFDGDNEASGWSDPYRFTTMVGDLDKDGNGIPDDKEVTVDWNGDGYPDFHIPSVMVKNSEGKTVIIGIEQGANTASIQAASPIDPDDTGAAGRPDLLPSGLIGFRVSITDSSNPAFVLIHLSDPAPDGAGWYKYDSLNGWRKYPHAEFSADRRLVTLELRDGSREYGDIDGVQNHIIVDPGGVGQVLSAVAPPDGKAGLGDSPGCFIGAAACGSTVEPGVNILDRFRDACLTLNRFIRKR